MVRRASDQIIRVRVWAATRPGFRAADRGAVTTETAIITGIITVAAAGLATLIASRVEFFQDMIPGG